MLLKMNLNSGNRFCMYFVNLFAVSLVSWIWMIVVLFSEFFIRLCRFGCCGSYINLRQEKVSN